MDSLLMLIEDIQNDIFDYRIGAFDHHFLQLIDLLAGEMETLTPEDKAVLNPVLQAILDAYELKDYLLIADLLAYELKPLIVVPE